MPDGAMPPPALTMRLAEWLAALRPADIPEPVAAAVRRLALDTMGASLHGMPQPWSQAIARWALAAAPGELIYYDAVGPLKTPLRMAAMQGRLADIGPPVIFMAAMARM